MPEFDMTDRVFGPPSTMGTSMGYANMSCRTCDVGWASVSEQGTRCWVCGHIGQYKGASFAGSNTRFVDECPPQYRKRAA